MQTVAERVKKIISEILNVKKDKISENSDFIDDLGTDIFDKLAIIMAFEEEFCLDIADEEIKEMKNIGQTIKCITRKIKNKNFRRRKRDRNYTERLIKLMLLN